MVSRSRTDGPRRWWLSVLFVALAGTWACNVSNNVAAPAGGRPVSDTSRWGTSPVFTPAHASAASAVRDFFGMRDEPVQPFDFLNSTCRRTVRRLSHRRGEGARRRDSERVDLRDLGSQIATDRR